MRTTMKDIAKACGVSAATVSMALSGNTKRVSADTMALIQETARKMNYHPNMMASNLAKGVSHAVGLVFNDIRNAHIAELYMAISPMLLQQGYSTICHAISSFETEKQCEELLRHVTTDNLCALLWARPYEPSKTQENAVIFDAIDSLGIPVFTMDEYGFKSPGLNLCIDYKKAAQMAVQYLISMGHSQIGCIAGNRSFKVTEDRIEGYRIALADAGLPMDESLIYEGDYTMNSGSQALSYLLGKGVTAIFCMNDEMAFGVYKQARSYHVRIPEELSVIGCDNVPYDEVLEVPLSTVGAPTVQMGQMLGREICEAVQKAKENGTASLGERKTIYFQPDLYIRGSAARAGQP